MLRGPLAVTVQYGRVRTGGMWSARSELVDTGAGTVPETRRSILVRTGTITPPQNATLVIDGVSYVVRSPPLLEEDGGLTRYLVTTA